MPSEQKKFAACTRCGSTRVRQRSFLAGPIVSANRGDNMFRCEICGHVGLLVTFDSEEALENFRSQKRTDIAKEEKPPPKVESIPIIPLYSRPMLDLSILEAAPFRTAEVVSVRWSGRGMEKTEYAANFEEYWRAVGSSKYRASTVYVLDLAGINRGEPSFQAMRELAKCDCKVLLDLGVSSSDEVMDGFMVDVERVIASTKTLKGPQDFSDIYSLTEECIPCIDWDDGIVWASGPTKDSVQQVVSILEEIGYDAVVLMDLTRLCTWVGPSMELAAIGSTLDLETYLGGGIKEEDIHLLLDKGIAAALVDPYTPMIRDMVIPKTTAPKPMPAESPQPVATKDAQPSPG